ncbi:hypothetical protein ACP6NG_17955 [Brevibacterium casei]|uniref:hypothetical protein n=1 Tax=Brevibacterium casei TaxID=33889 RepID=UPI003F815C10
MALEQPWAITGPEITAATARQIAYQASGGSSGVAGSRDLLVRATSTPSNSVEVLPGSYVVKNINAAYQSYSGRNVGAELVEIPASGSSGSRTWYIGVELDDGDYSGNTLVSAEQVDTFEYAKFAVRGSLTATKKTFLPLAKITVPANTATITNAMITSLRELSNPRFKDEWFPRPTVNKDIVGYSHDLRARRKGSDHLRGEQFPDSAHGGSFDVECPTWATRMLVSVQWTGVRYSGKSAWGACYLSFVAPNSVEKWTQDFGWDVLENNVIHRTNWLLNDTLPVPNDMKGKTIRFYLKAFLDNAAPVGAVEMDSRSGLNFQIRFLEDVDEQVEG